MAKNIFIIVAFLALVIFGPFITICALNTLFPVLVIPYTFSTWLAVIWLGCIFIKVEKD